MQAGKLRHRVTLQSPGGARDAVGQRATTYSDVATVWADVSPLSAREFFAAQQMQSEVTHKVRMRYDSSLSSLDASWRVKFGADRYLVIAGVRNIEERNRELELLCYEGAREE